MDSYTISSKFTSSTTMATTTTMTTSPFEQPVNHHSNGFCPACGVDVSRFSHEFWCQFNRR